MMKTQTNQPQMNADANPEKRKGAKGAKDGSVLQIGFAHFWFDSHEDAARAFALLSKATHVQQEYKGRSKRPFHDYFPRELIGELSVTIVERSALKVFASPRLCVNPERSEP